MRVTAVEAKTRFGELLDRVEAGEEVVITRRGKVVARMERDRPRPSPEEVRKSIERMRAVGLRLEPGESIKDLISRGRM